MDDIKSKDAYRSISEAADIIGVATHVLRFWESKFHQVHPMKRRGRRYYRHEDIVMLQHIKTLLHEEGLTIKGVQKYLKDHKLTGKQLELFQQEQSENTTSHKGFSKKKKEQIEHSIHRLDRICKELEALA